MESTETKTVRLLHPVHYNIEHPRGAVIELPAKTADHLAQSKIVEILSTIVEPQKSDETTSSGTTEETEGETKEEASKTSKKTSKRRIDSDDE